MKSAQQIQAFVRRHREEMVGLLTRLAQAESPSSEAKAQAAPIMMLWEAFAGLGFELEHVPGKRTGGHLCARYPDGAGAPQQLLLGHCDTVWPVGTLKEMPVAVEDGVMRGPGVFDMKGGLVQMVFALRALHSLSLTPTVAPLILINSDEEIGSIESGEFIRRLARQADRALVLEPALGKKGRLKTRRKGVGRFTVTVQGKAAHAGLEPDEGISAVLELSHVIQKLFALNEPEQGVSVNVGVIEGGVRTNVIAPQSKAYVDVRAPTAAAAAQVEKAIRELEPSISGTAVTVSGGFSRPPLEKTAANKVLWRMARKRGRALGIKLKQGTAGGASDGNLTSQHTATLDGLGPVGGGAHARHEFIYLDKLEERTTLLALLLLAPAVTDKET